MFRIVVKNIQSNYFEYALYLLTVSLFFGNAFVSIATVVFYFTLLPNMFNYKAIKFKNLFFIKPFLLMVSHFLVSFLVLCATSSSLNEVLVIEKYLPFLLFPIIILNNRDILINKQIAFNVRLIFIVTALFSFAMSFLYGLWRMFFLEENINHIFITYNFLTDLFGVHHIYLSSFYALALIFCLDNYFDHAIDTRKKYLLFSIILFLAIILLSSRTVILATVAIIFIKIMLNKKKKLKKVLSIFFSTILFGIILTISIPTLKNRIVNFNTNISSYSGSSFRLKVWSNVFEISKDSPVFGYGLNKSQDVLLNQYYKVNFRRAFLRNFNAHNQYLQTIIDEGLIGFIFLLLMLLSPLFYSKKRDSVFLFTILMLIVLISESFLIRQYGIVFYCLFFCLLLIENNNYLPKLKPY